MRNFRGVCRSSKTKLLGLGISKKELVRRGRSVDFCNGVPALRNSRSRSSSDFNKYAL